MNALGMIPTYLSLLQHFEKPQRRNVCLRELLIALGVMCVYFFLGKGLLHLLDVKPTTTEIAGGVILLLISIKLVFSKEDLVEKWTPGKHFIVPIATPVMASPSLFATIMIFTEGELDNGVIFLALLLAWFVSAIIYVFARPIYSTVNDKGLDACQRLMGLLVGLIAVEKMLDGVQTLLR